MKSLDNILNDDPLINPDRGFCKKHRIRKLHQRKDEWEKDLLECPDCREQAIKRQSK